MDPDFPRLDDPMELAIRWIREALETAPDPGFAKRSEWATAMSLATADAEGRPSVRYVLLKGVDARGFSFYTNRESRKGLELDARPHAAIAIWWPWRNRQIRAEGDVVRLSDAESDAYFATRPRLSQIGAWASMQSRELRDPADLERRVAEMEVRFPGNVPRPPHWGGYLLQPERVEFWTAREGRLHERIVAIRTAKGFRTSRLQP